MVVADKHTRATRILEVGLKMCDNVNWVHVKEAYYRYEGNLYDLTNAPLNDLNKVVGNPHYMIKRRT